MDLIFANQANDREFFVSRIDAVASQEECTQCYARAQAAALTSGLTVEAFAPGDAEGMRGPRCGCLRIKLVAPTSQAAALVYGRLFEVYRRSNPCYAAI